jgi:hypothetical protein
MTFFGALVGLVSGSILLQVLFRTVAVRTAATTGSAGCGCLTSIVLLIIIGLIVL